jgi:hypothetical protein
MADKKADKYLGGQSGVAAKALRSRQDQLDAEERKATGEPEPTKKAESSRPPQSKKWYE